METKGDFHGTEIDFAKELVEARKLMGLKTTDMDQLHSTVSHLYLSCPDDMRDHYLATLNEIDQRKMMMDFPQLFNVTGLGSMQ